MQLSQLLLYLSQSEDLANVERRRTDWLYHRAAELKKQLVTADDSIRNITPILESYVAYRDNLREKFDSIMKEIQELENSSC